MAQKFIKGICGPIRKEITSSVFKNRCIYGWTPSLSYNSFATGSVSEINPGYSCRRCPGIGLFEKQVLSNISISANPLKFVHTSTSNHQAFEDKETKTLTLWSNLKEVRRSPVPALTLGLSGLIPFIAAPAYMITSNIYIADIAFMQLAYGACILSFLGGVRWGFTIPEENPVHPDWVNLGYSVMPSLIAWGGLLLPMPVSIFTVMSGLVFAGYCDMAMYGYPPWFKGLRFVLSFIAVLSLWTSFMCSFMLKTVGKSEA